MPWPNIPTLIYTDAVKVRSITWVNPDGTPSKDAAGGRKQVVGTWGANLYPCSVSAAGANDVAVHSRESMVVTHVVTCTTRLGYMRDQLQWQETGAILTIVGVEPAGDGTGRVWNHFVEERPLR